MKHSVSHNPLGQLVVPQGCPTLWPSCLASTVMRSPPGFAAAPPLGVQALAQVSLAPHLSWVPLHPQASSMGAPRASIRGNSSRQRVLAWEHKICVRIQTLPLVSHVTLELFFGPDFCYLRVSCQTR